jgi:ankyrin repeat protein
LVPYLTYQYARSDCGWPALIWATIFGQTENVRLLLERGADVNARGKYVGTALMCAATKRHKEIECLILQLNME